MTGVGVAAPDMTELIRARYWDLASSAGPSASRHRSSHQGIWTEVRPPSGFSVQDASRETLDLIVVPTARSFASDLPGLRLALEIADRLSSQLVVLCSKDARVADFPWDLAKAMDLTERRGLRPIVLEHDSDALPQSQSARSPIAKLRRPVDTGPKRNQGLVLAHQRGARNVLFLDDDIKQASHGPTLDRLSLGHALAQLRTSSTLRAVGFTASDQPDNSVVCHIRRLVGREQRIFLGAGALLVKLDGAVPHFPVSMYNEDWFFMMYLGMGAPDYTRALGWAGDVHQSASPMCSAERAWSEEVGDLIGEALMNLFEDHGAAFLDLADAAFWQRAIHARQDMLCDLRTRLRGYSRTARPDRDAAIDALRAATAAYSVIKPEAICAYLEAVTDDQQAWSQLYHW